MSTGPAWLTPLSLSPCSETDIWVRSVQHLRDLKSFFGTTFKIKDASPPAPTNGFRPAGAPAVGNDDDEDDEEEEDSEGAAGKVVQAKEEYILSCVGTGFTNTAKRAG